jgi:hypothetical protein
MKEGQARLAANKAIAILKSPQGTNSQLLLVV